MAWVANEVMPHELKKWFSTKTLPVELIKTNNNHVIEQIRLLFMQLISNYKFKSVYHRLRVLANKVGPRICVQFFQNTF